MRLLWIIAIFTISISPRKPIKIYYYANSELVEIIEKKPPKEEDVKLLARLIQSEALSEGYIGMVMVGEVVRNRMKFKDMSLEQIIYRRDSKGRPQFDGIDTKYFNAKPLKLCLKAAYDVLDYRTKVLPQSIYYYHNKALSTDNKWVRYLSNYEYITVNNHTFCYHPNLVPRA